jgi:Ca2+-binding EF-hand superfamily protein
MGFTMSQEQIFELLKAVDENFEGKISYEKME